MEDEREGVNGLGLVAPLPATYCVTGATGYIGSWLVAALLERGYTVHATVRNPEKSLHLLSLSTGGDRLRFFKAELHEEGSFDEAVKGCDGVFHVAASMEFNVHEKEDIEDYVQSNILDPAIKGTLNLLKSCLKSNSVKRVVFTSSISTLTAKDSNEKWKSIVDESCQIDTDHVWNTKASGWVYALSKLLTEEAAFKFAKENGMDLVSVITTTVAGPFFTTNVPSSVKVLLSPITGENEFSNILSAVNARMGSIASVHIEDICRAHIFLMEHAKAEGYAYGGLSELPESEYFFCSMGPSIAVEIGVFGYRPSVLMAMLAGKRAEVGTKVGAYMRTFFGDCSPTDVETSLQIEMTSL